MSRRFGPVACLLWVLATAAAGAAQEAPRPEFLFLNQERILTGSERGRALLEDEEAARDALRAEAREIEMAFEAEERSLTERRPKLDAAEFRALADAFDERVVAARRDQDARAGALAADLDQRRRQFYADVAPILVGVMESLGALAIFDETSILLADQALNITETVIAEIDRAAAADEPAPQVPDAPAEAPEQ